MTARCSISPETNLVDLADRDQWLAAAGARNLPSGNAYSLGDSNLDGTVDGQDFVLWNQAQVPVDWSVVTG